MYNSFGELPGFTAVKQNGLHVGVEDSYFSVVGSWAHSRPKHVEKRNRHTKKIMHQFGFIYKIIQG
jgi:hypothetical protein